MRIARVARQGVISSKRGSEKKEKQTRIAYTMTRFLCASHALAESKVKKGKRSNRLDAADEIIIQINSSVLFLGA